MSQYLEVDDTTIKIDNFGKEFLLITAEDSTKIPQIGSAIFRRKFNFVDEVIVTEVEICLKVNDSFSPYKMAELNLLDYGEVLTTKSYDLPVYFGRDLDWAEIVSYSGFEKEQYISELVKSKLNIAMFGFLPGFMYIDGMASRLHVPRKKVPSKYVEANSIAIGGKYLGIYSLDSPGGWHVIGKTPLTMVSFEGSIPTILNPGDRIKIKSIGQTEFERLLSDPQNLFSYNG